MPIYEAQLIPSGAAILRKTGAVPIADCRDDAGGPLKADLVAPAAKQMGAYVGQRIATLVAGGSLPGPFTYHHQGDLATIGRKSAIVSIGRIKLTGFVGWLFWCLVHIMFLIGFRTRLVVSINWFWGFVTLQRSVRLISDGSPRSAVKAPAPPSWAPLRSSLDIPWRQTWPRRSLTSSPTTSSHSDLTA